MRIIAVSANSNDEGTNSECHAAGFDGVLEKPLTLPMLRELTEGETLSSAV